MKNPIADSILRQVFPKLCSLSDLTGCFPLLSPFTNPSQRATQKSEASSNLD
jgi:hypothetical protein